MNDTEKTGEQILSMLERAPARIAAITSGLSARQLIASPGPGDWSARDVLAHLRSCSDMWGGAIARILAEDRPTIKAVNPRTWIRQTDYLEQDFEPSLRAYTIQRAELLETLRLLAPEAWARGATVTGAGKPIERTVYSYALWLANHERSHIRQMERIAAAANS